MTGAELYFIVGGPLIALAIGFALVRLTRPKHPAPGE